MESDEKIPNEETQKAIEDAEKGIDVYSFDNVEDLFKWLDE